MLCISNYMIFIVYLIFIKSWFEFLHDFVGVNNNIVIKYYLTIHQ